jgi:hypothetical protein
MKPLPERRVADPDGHADEAVETVDLVEAAVAKHRVQRLETQAASFRTDSHGDARPFRLREPQEELDRRIGGAAQEQLRQDGRPGVHLFERCGPLDLAFPIRPEAGGGIEIDPLGFLRRQRILGRWHALHLVPRTDKFFHGSRVVHSTLLPGVEAAFPMMLVSDFRRPVNGCAWI